MASTPQERVAAFVTEHDLEAPPAYRLLDAVAEVGEVAADLNESTTYGAEPADAGVSPGEVGDALFSLLAFADAVGVDAESALTEAMDTYERRLDTRGSAGSPD